MWKLLTLSTLLIHVASAGKLYILPSPPSKPQDITFQELVQVQSHLLGYSHQLPSPLLSTQYDSSDNHPLNNPALQLTKSWSTHSPSSGLFILVSGWEDTDDRNILATSPTFTFDDSSLNVVAYLDDIASRMASSFQGEIVQVTSERGGEAFVGGVSRLLMLENKPMLAVPKASELGGKLKNIAETVYTGNGKNLFNIELEVLEGLLAETSGLSQNGFYIMSITQLANVVKISGADSKEYKSAADRVQALIQKITSDYIGNSAPDATVQVMTVPTSVPLTNGRRIASVINQAVDNTSYICPADVATCQSLFKNCSGRGTCNAHALIPNHAPCYLCTCRTYPIDANGTEITTGRKPVVWAGNSCQYQDISFDFGIVFFVSVTLIIVLIVVVKSMIAVGGDETVGAGAGTRSKQD